MHIRTVDGKTPSTVNTSVARTRRYLTGREVEKLMEAARKHGRYGHRDATMILLTYRHGLRASELCDLQWHQVEINNRPAARPQEQKGHAVRASDAGRRNSRPKAPAARAGGIAVCVHQ